MAFDQEFSQEPSPEKKCFLHTKKTFLQKMDKSKKCSLDQRIIPLLDLINAQDDYYTTSSCSGRVCFWTGSGKKSETKWLKVSHDLITADFLNLGPPLGLVWLRVEPFILHVCCQDLNSANKFLELAKRIFKKSSLLSVQNKIMVEVRGSEWLEMPFSREGLKLFSQPEFLLDLVNSKLNKIHQNTDLFFRELKPKL